MRLLLFFFTPATIAAEIETKKGMSAVSYDHILSWSMSLFIVLLLFFVGVWFFKKTGAFPLRSKESMKIISGLSLGGREKLMLVQVGKKQLLLGLSPGNITNLLVLEGDEQIGQEIGKDQEDGQFLEKLKQAMGKANE